MTLEIKYRPEIDGLRAIAVTSVVLYHFDRTILSGGYVGVDIFFVISGYLITSIICRDFMLNKFSMINFWEKRARRILPALFVVVFSSLFVGYFVLMPREFEALGEQVQYNSMFLSNYLFYKQQGYFDISNELKPLLHTWSLSVEEQYYLIYPAMLVLLLKFIKEKTLFTLLAIIVISFAMSVYGVFYSPKSAFYLLHMRAWELALGAAIVFLSKRYLQSTLVSNIASYAGFLLIVFSVTLFDDKIYFPGYSALAPCLGAALIIWSNSEKQNSLAKLLSLRPIVFVGLISYSWYLWHWPALVYMKYISSNTGELALGIMLVSTFFISVLSWKYIETPFRKKRYLVKRERYLAVSAVTSMVFISVGGFIYKSEGLPGRLSEPVANVVSAYKDINPMREKCMMPDLDKIKEANICQTLTVEGTDPKFLLWGDSHADAIQPALNINSNKYGINGYVAAYPGCPPILDHYQKRRGKSFYCKEFNDEVFSLVKRENIKYVILAASWFNWARSDTNIYFKTRDNQHGGYDNIVIEGVDATINKLISEGVHVYFMRSIPIATFDPPRRLGIYFQLREKIETPSIAKQRYMAKRRITDELIRRNINKEKFTVIDPVEALCEKDICKVLYKSKSLYSNGGHLSSYGAEFVSGIFDVVFKDLKAN